MAESRELRYFVAVGERLNFSRAAEELHISQSTLSEAIRRLETALGVELLRRNTRRAALTPAGEVLLVEARPVRDGACDVAFVWLPADASGLELEVVATERRYAGLAREHRLADRPRLSIADLADEPIMWTRRAPRFWVDCWAVNPRPDGSEPVWGPVNDNVEEMLEQVAQGAAMCISPHSMATHYARPDLAWVPIDDIEPLRIAVARRRGDDSPLVTAFFETALEAPRR